MLPAALGFTQARVFTTPIFSQNTCTDVTLHNGQPRLAPNCLGLPGATAMRKLRGREPHTPQCKPWCWEHGGLKRIEIAPSFLLHVLLLMFFKFRQLCAANPCDTTRATTEGQNTHSQIPEPKLGQQSAHDDLPLYNFHEVRVHDISLSHTCWSKVMPTIWPSMPLRFSLQSFSFTTGRRHKHWHKQYGDANGEVDQLHD